MLLSMGLSSFAYRTQAISAAQQQSLFDNRFLVIPRWLSASDTEELRADTLAVHDAHGFDSHVGTLNKGTMQLNHDIRRSRQCNLYPPPSNAAGSVQTRASLIKAVNNLREELQQSLTLNLPPLAPFQTELNYLLYPSGGHYMRHLDVPGKDDGWQFVGRQAHDGGSFNGCRTRRVVSFILYLNENWDVASGGELRVFPSGGDFEDVLPEGGTLVLLMSRDLEHLVRETRRERQCVVGWFKEETHERTPDRDPFSLRSRDHWG